MKILIAAACAALLTCGTAEARTAKYKHRSIEVAPVTWVVSKERTARKFYRKTRPHKYRLVKRARKAPTIITIGGGVSAKALGICRVKVERISALANVVSWPIERLVRPIVRPIAEQLTGWELALLDEREDTVQYLVRTATPGGTMTAQGPRNSIEWMHPEFSRRLAGAIREARANGLPKAGIFSAFRPVKLGVGGFRDKFRSNHGIGQAVDMAGIGRPGSREALQWQQIASRYGLFNPYGYRNRAEWNHYQPQTMLAVAPGSAIRQTVDRNGPIALPGLRMVLAGGDYVVAAAGLARMWDVGTSLIRAPSSFAIAPVALRPRYAARHHHRARYARSIRHRTVERAPSFQPSTEAHRAG